MSVSRRRFLGQVGVGSAAFGLVGTGALPSPLVSARGREALWSPQGQGQGAVDPGAARRADRRLAAAPGIVRIDSNENPVGPGAKAIDAIRAHFDESNRYPVIAEDELMGTIARPTIASMTSSLESAARSVERTTRPSRMMVTCCVSADTSSNRWVMNNTATPSRHNCRTMENSWSTSGLDKAAVGSSITSTWADCTSALAISTIC